MFDAASIANNPAFLFILKIGVVVLLGLYILFLLVIVKQIRSMNTIVTQPNLFPIIQTAAFILIAFTVFLFLLGLAIL